jgi:hypothetical protein
MTARLGAYLQRGVIVFTVGDAEICQSRFYVEPVDGGLESCAEPGDRRAPGSSDLGGYGHYQWRSHLLCMATALWFEPGRVCGEVFTFRLGPCSRSLGMASVPA